MRINGFFDEARRLESIDKLGDPLQKLNKYVEWDVLEEMLEGLLKKKAQGAKPRGVGGRPAYRAIVMLRILILQKFYNLSDEQAELQIKDRLTFTRFLGLGLGDRIPDAKTIWHYREEWIKGGVLEALFEALNEYLEEKGIITHTGSIVDATFIDRRNQRMSKEEYAQICKGEIPQRVQEKEHRLAQVDRDARIGKKSTPSGTRTCNGFKLSVKMDATSKTVTGMGTTPANVSDSKMIIPLVNEKDRVIYADKGYSGKEIRRALKEKMGEGGIIEIHEKASRKHPLSKEALERNRMRSKIRVRIEHVFAVIKHDWKFKEIRSVGIVRAHGNLVIAILAYNIKRYSILAAAREERSGSTVPA